LASFNIDFANAALGAMAEAGRGDLAPSVVPAFGTVNVLSYLSARVTRDVSDIQKFHPWIVAATSSPGHVAEFLAHQKSIPRAFLVSIAHLLAPDKVPNDFGSDPWWVAVGNSSGPLKKAEQQYLDAYLLSRSLGVVSNSSGELAELTLDPIYTAAAAGDLSSDAWELIKAGTPSAGYWWDRCKRIRAAVVEMFIRRNLPARAFVKVTADNEVFEDLVNEASLTWDGRNFLWKVREEIDGDRRFRKRSLVLDKALRWW
jgi:hypothetical protein